MILPALRRAAFALALLAGLAATPARAEALRYCDTPTALGHGQRDRLFRFAGIVRDELEGSGQRLALVARSGLDLSRFGMRYSHAGVSLKGNAVAPWSVRQLYYDCEERRPRIFDQGLTAFLLGMSNEDGGYLSVVLLPEDAATALEPAALDDRLALRLLAGTYSANAYVWGLQYQNCNQWVAELLASAWGGADPSGDARAQAQAWLRAQGYEASTFHVPFAPLSMWAVAVTPWLHHSDHPSEDLQQAVYRVSMPASIEAFVQARLPAARRLEFCRSGARVVVRRGWAPIAEGCEPGPQDRVVMLD
ncbi:DUF2145 domain-containing protein [Variovorax sp. YR752]|uniref:DUF2145 domain-containing protein n=1 Tax=Variovorax sp. YR752 TaxID=1884383 RepID=UPI0031379309